MYEILATNMTHKIGFFRMDNDVRCKQRFRSKSFMAVGTSEFVIVAVRFEMRLVTNIGA